MICIRCNKKINRSYGAPNLLGNYCLECATLMQITPDLIHRRRPPNCGSSVQKPNSNITPISADKDTVALIEQLNGLLDRYNALYSFALKHAYTHGAPSTERLNKTLENIEEAIAALCLRITEKQYIVTIKE